MSDIERENQLATHRATLTELTRPGGAIEALAAAASINNPEWYRPATGLPRSSRAQLLDRILSDYRDRTPGVRRGRVAILLAGPPGSGKSSVLDSLLEAAGTTRNQWRVLDADAFKDLLLLVSIDDGSFDGHLTPAAVRDAQARGERIWPRERAALVHEESSQLMKRARAAAIAAGENIIVDGTLSNAESAKVLAGQLELAGYSIKIAVVDAPRAVTVARADYRWATGYRQATDGTATYATDGVLGGRWVPDQVVDAMYKDPASSVCRSSAVTVAESSPAVVELSIYRVDRADGAPELVELRKGRRPGGGWRRVQRRGTARPTGLSPEQEKPSAGCAPPYEGASAAKEPPAEPGEVPWIKGP